MFETLYALHGDIERQGERIELVLGDGRLIWDVGPTGQGDDRVDHPVLLQRVDLVFDPDVPEFRVVDSDRRPELYGPLLLAGGTLSGEKLDELSRELEQGGFHPLAGDETSAFLRRVVSLLGPTGVLHEQPDEASRDAEGPVMVRDAWLFARDRSAGFAAAFDRVLEDLEGDGELPAALTRIVGLEPARRPGPRAPRRRPTAALLLSKPANAEQVQIVRALEQHRAVLVQGPPGTGKSHTIANLVGHLVAQGKRVLVTSYTTKALRVLREQVVEELRPLCVSVLDNDLEGRTQMEQAVRGIVHRLSTSTEERLAAEAQALTDERERLQAEVERLTAELRAAREDEYLPIRWATRRSARPTPPATWRSRATGWASCPGPLPPGAALPLSDGELRELYASNDEVSRRRRAGAGRARCPSATEVLPAPTSCAADVELITEQQAGATAGATGAAAPELADSDGAGGGRARGRAAAGGAWPRWPPGSASWWPPGAPAAARSRLWRQLAEQVKQAAHTLAGGPAAAAGARPHHRRARCPGKALAEQLARDPGPRRAGRQHQRAVDAVPHRAGGRCWSGCRVQRPAARRTAAHFAALAAAGRGGAGPGRAGRALGAPGRAGRAAAVQDACPIRPSRRWRDYVQQFERLLGLWAAALGPDCRASWQALGFVWDTFRADEIARATPSAPFESDLHHPGRAAARRRWTSGWRRWAGWTPSAG